MNFPLELIYAAGALPLLIQESREPITVGRSMLFEFYCGYTRSIVDQAMIGQFSALDAIFLVDHCVALLGAADAIRYELPDLPIYLAQYVASMDEDTTRPEIAKKVAELRAELEKLCGTRIDNAAIAESIRQFNRNRRLQRHIYALRRSGQISLSAAQVRAIVQSSMVMDVVEHSALLETLIPLLESAGPPSRSRVKLHLSGHFCHAPHPELLTLIEDCGATVIDDDLFTGYRFIATDIAEGGDPVEALTQWYFARNANVPCATRAQRDVDWEEYLANAVETSGADGVIILMAKFCEPHMLYFPELRKELNRRGIPFLLIETEHEGQALEMLRTRVEALIEQICHAAIAHAGPP